MVVLDGVEALCVVAGELDGMRSGLRCFDAALLNFEGESSGDGAALEVGQDML